MRSDCAVMVFAKAPVPGFAKSRLALTMGEDRAAALAARMLDETLQQALVADIGPVELCCTPDVSHPAFENARKAYRISLSLQQGVDLGARMSNAFMRTLKHYPLALLAGTDLPQLQATHFCDAAEALASHDAVFIPTADGGYGLVGLSRHSQLLFEGIEWGSSRVLQQTRDRLKSLGVTWFELPMMHDVDEPGDLVHVPTAWLE